MVFAAVRRPACAPYFLFHQPQKHRRRHLDRHIRRPDAAARANIDRVAGRDALQSQPSRRRHRNVGDEPDNDGAVLLLGTQAWNTDP